MDKFHDTFDVYTDEYAAGNHYFPSGWMGDTDAISVDTDWQDNCYAGNDCIRIRFTAGINNWGGAYWQTPEDNWGTIPDAGYDLTGATQLTFNAKGEKGGERIEFFAGGIEGSHPDSLPKVSTGTVTLTSTWQLYSIDLTEYSHSLTHVIGGFGWTASSDNNPGETVAYLDDIQYNKHRNDEPHFLASYETLATIDPDRFIRGTSFVYDNALIVLAYLVSGEPDERQRAKILANAFLYAQNNDRYYNDGRLRNAYMAGDLADHTTSKARLPGWWDPDTSSWDEDGFQTGTHTGNTAWVMLALIACYEEFGDSRYLDAALTLGNWIVNNTHDDRGAGGYTSGYQGGMESAPVKLQWKSTEQNIDVYVAFSQLYDVTGDSLWNERSEHARVFVTAMWNPEESHFWTGTLDDGITPNSFNYPIDIQAWAVLVFRDYYESLGWAELNGTLSADNLTGFDFNTDLDGIWFEGTAQMVVAYKESGNTDKAEFYLNQIRNAQQSATNSNGMGIVAASRNGITTGFEWLYYNRLHTGATAWFLFADMGISPFSYKTATIKQ